MRRRLLAVALCAVALSGTGCFRLCERWFGPNCGGCCAPCRPPRESPPVRPGEERIPPAALPSAPSGGAPPATLPPVPNATGVGAYGGT